MSPVPRALANTFRQREQTFTISEKESVSRLTLTRGVRDMACFKVKEDEACFGGRCLVATRDIAQGEVIIEEETLMSGPCGDTHWPICIACYRVITGSAHICNGCKWLLCNEACEKAVIHAKYECRVFKNGEIKPTKEPEAYFNLTVLRCCILKELNPKKYAQLLQLYPIEKGKGGKGKKPIAPAAIANFIYKSCNKKAVDQEDLTKLDVIVRMFPFATTDVLSRQSFPRMARLLFFNAGMLSHACQPNASWTRVEHPDNTFSIKVWASLDIKAEEKITLQFLDVTRPHVERKFHLDDVNKFTCQCPLCSSPNHDGSYYGSVKCPKCKKAYMVATEPLKFSDSVWKCEACPFTQPYREVVVPTETTVVEEVEKCYELEEFETVLASHAGQDLHPNHWLMMDCRQEIVDRMFGYITTIKPVEKMKEAAQKMLDYCTGLNARIEMFYPGHNRIRARHLIYTRFAQVVLEKGEAALDDTELDWLEEVVRKGQEMSFFSRS